jgi:hypothetical protein
MPLIIVLVSTTTRLPAGIDHALEFCHREAFAARPIPDGSGRRAKLRGGFRSRFGFRQPAYLYRNAQANDAFLLLGKRSEAHGDIRAYRNGREVDGLHGFQHTDIPGNAQGAPWLPLDRSLPHKQAFFTILPQIQHPFWIRAAIALLAAGIQGHRKTPVLRPCWETQIRPAASAIQSRDGRCASLRPLAG